jgi:CPA2 family monovalent cation:H+ antiporter-2
MDHLPALISDLAVILLAAGIITILFKAIKQPVVLGYILAGLIAGPHLNLFHVTDIENIRIWADIGVIFLLFSLGLDFSFKKLFHVGGTAFITAITIVVGMMTLGYLTGKLFGWSHINCLFLGGMIAMSSTTIIAKSFDDMGLRNQLFAGLVIGVLVVEDIVAVILMVLLPTISMGNDVPVIDMVFSVLRLIAFVIIWFLCGIFIIPSLLKKTKRWLNDETMLVVSLALCLGMVLLATKIGLSAALGAFVMGSLLAETLEAERIELLVRPVKNFFGAIFFVSVGMMISPIELIHYWLPILVISIAVIVGQISFGTLGMILSGQPLKVSIQAGFSLPQVGEFAFIIASLGVSLGVTRPDLYPIIVAVSVITIFFTPFFIKSAEPAYKKINQKLPAKWLKAINRLSSSPQLMNSENKLQSLMKELTRIVSIYTFICVVIIFVGMRYLNPALHHFFKGKIIADILVAFIIILAMAPFLRSILVRKNRTIRQFIDEGYLNRGPLIALMIARILLCLGLVMFVIGTLFHLSYMLIFMIAALVVAIIILSKWLKKSSISIENRFLTNLAARQEFTESKKPLRKEFVHNLLARDIHLADFEITSNYPHAGQTLRELHIRQKFGVNIVSILRGDFRINIPDGDQRIFPGDRIIVVGSDHQLMRLSYSIEEFDSKETENEQKDVVLEHLLLEEGSKLIGKTIFNAALREKYRCLIIGIDREHSSKMNPDINEQFRLHDIIWLVGEKQKIVELMEDHK